jgi:hypothetical protein
VGESDSSVGHFNDLRPTGAKTFCTRGSEIIKMIRNGIMTFRNNVRNGIMTFLTDKVFWSGQVDGVVKLGFHPVFHYFLALREFDVSSSPPSLDFMSPGTRRSVLIEGEYLVNVFLRQFVCPIVIFCFSYHKFLIVS